MVAAGSLVKQNGKPTKNLLYQKATVPLLNEPLAWTYAAVPWLDHQSTCADCSTPCCLYHSLLSDYTMLTVVIIALYKSKVHEFAIIKTYKCQEFFFPYLAEDK